MKIVRIPTGSLNGTIYFLDHGGQPVAANTLHFEGGTLRFVNQFPGLTYTGRMSANGNSISGTVQQSGSFALILEKASPETEWAIPPPAANTSAMAAEAQPGVEVATIKPTSPGALRTVITFRGSEIVISRMTLMDLVQFSYNLHEKQIVNGADWMSTDKFDINAQPDQPGKPNSEQFRTILQKLMADRFALKFHDAQKQMSAFVLTVSPNSPKLTKSADLPGMPVYSVGPGGLIRMHNATVGDFAALMQTTVLDRPVVDHTGLGGRWDFSLKWTPDESQFGGQLPAPSNPESLDNPPTLRDALQEQLGLKFAVEKTSVKTMMIDHVEHPSPN